MLFFLVILKYLINVIEKTRNMKIIKNLADIFKNEVRVRIRNFLDMSKGFFIVIFFF